MDYLEMVNMFDKEVVLPKYARKKWIKISPTQNAIVDNGNGLSQAINYNCRNVSNKIINYHRGYILLTATASRAVLADKLVAPKGSFAFINQAVVKINGAEVDNTSLNFLTVPILNSLEYSNDYARVASQYCFSRDTAATHENNAGHTTRKGQIPAPVGNALQFSVKIPLTYVSTFFRALDFPLVNQEFDFDITYRTTNAVLREDAGAITVVINSAVMYLPAVELAREYDAQLMKKMGSSTATKSLVWDKFANPIEVIGANGVQDIQLQASLDGMRKLFCVAVPTARWDSQQRIESTSNTSITGINIIIDSENFFPHDVQNDIEAYELVAENFNMGGQDPTMGAILDFNDWLSTHRYYVFDLSRQKIFESDPRIAQTIRFKGTLSAASRLVFFITKQKKTTFDFKNPAATTTV